jgi:hypothetical protein
MATFAKAIGTWGMYTSALFALANTTGKLGFGRKEIEVMSGESTPNEPSKPAFAGAEASL